MRKKLLVIIAVSIMALALLVPMVAFASDECNEPRDYQECNDPCACQECSDPCDTQCPEPECPPVQCCPEPECPPVQCCPEPECPPVQCCPDPECPPVQCCPEPECPPVQCCPEPECPPCQCSYEGLTPGYWKNHVSEWECYSTDTTLEGVFDVPDSLGLDDYTLLEALKFHGGPELDGMARNMFRHAVAALLNACSSEVNYPYNMNEVINMVNGVDWTSRSSMEDLKDTFAAANELELHS